MGMPTLLLKTYPHLKTFAKKEIRDILDVKVKEHGKWEDFLEITVDRVDISTFKLILFSRSFSRVYWRVQEAQVPSKEALYKVTRQALQWHEVWEETEKFAVIPEVRGNHDLTKSEIGKKVGQAIVDTFEEEGDIHAEVSLDRPDVRILARVKQDFFTLALDLVGKDVNTDLEMINSGILQYSNWKREKRLGEIFCSGLADLAYDYGRKLAQRDKISGITLAKLKIVDEKKILNFLRKNWERTISSQIWCFEEKERKNQFREVMKGEITYTSFEDIPHTNIQVFVSNIINHWTDRRREEEYISELIKKVMENDSYQNFTFLMRKDVHLPETIRSDLRGNPKLREGPKFKGIKTQFVKIEG